MSSNRSEPGSRPGWVSALRVVALLAVAAAAVAVLRDKLPSLDDVGAALGAASWWWVAAALAAQLVSIGMLTRQQRRLLHAFGVPVTLWTVSAITYSSNAISLSLPAGSAVGAGYTYHAYRRTGATARTAATVLLLSGLLSLAALVLLYLAGFGIAAALHLLPDGAASPALIAWTTLGTLVLITGLIAHHHRRLSHPGRPSPATRRVFRWTSRHPRIAPLIHTLGQTSRQARHVARRDWNVAVATSLGNWAFDVASLYASCRAFGIAANVFELALIYIGVQLVRHIPLTPGGIGIIEAALLAALIATGAPTGPASAAVLLYRLCSAWLLLPIGYLMLALLKRSQRAAGES